MSQFSTMNAAAISQTVTIRTVQPFTLTLVNGTITKTPSHELVEIENVSNDTIDMTGWALKYQSASGTTLQTLKNISPGEGADVTLFPAHSRDTFLSSAYSTAYGILSGFTFSLSLSDSAGNVVLVNSLGQEIDRVGWRAGSASNIRSETEAALIFPDTSTIQRVGVDTDNNLLDFQAISGGVDHEFVFGGMYDATDLCKNINGIQETPPDGMVAYDDYTCSSADQCSNIEGIQLQIPDHYKKLVTGECVEYDACLNIEGTQHSLPENYDSDGENCFLKFVAKNILLTELLPNPEGADDGLEFIELYNATEEVANLADYSLNIVNKTYHFPSGKLLLPYSYISFSDEEVGFTFPNTTGPEVQLVAKDGTVTSIMSQYSNAPVGQSWNKINETWGFSNQPTRGGENKTSISVVDEEEIDTVASTYAACAPNQYRSLETNRCRRLPSDAISLAPCKEGQYRSEETNRCRSIVQTVSASLKPCNDDQFRNPASGRCKKIASTDDFLQPCDEGWERNSDTNRCRKIKATSLPLAAFPVTKTDPAPQSLSMMLAGLGIIIGALGYAAWEWRKEIGMFASSQLNRIFWWRK